MAKYWWQCSSCGDRPAWLAVCKSRSLAAFIWDELAPSGWNQELLASRCSCKRGTLRITYRLKSGDPDRVSIKCLVGLKPTTDQFIPMLWETFRHSKPRESWIDFKYQRGRSPWGFTKRLTLQKSKFSQLLRAYFLKSQK